jgi:ATP/maltotriose-dependent transcriptional regulator MalT
VLLEGQGARIDLTETGIYDYLMSEVFENQPDQVQHFLLHTSVLDELTEPLCDTLMGRESQAILRTIRSNNLFISRVEQAGLETTYRYHPLFHEFLISRLRRTDEARYKELHVRAADHFAHRMDWHAALVHYAEAERFAEIKDIMLRHYDELSCAGHYESLALWIDLLPPDQFSVGLQLKRAMLANALEQSDTALCLYANAIAHFESQGNKTQLALALIERSWALSRSGGYDQAIADCQEALLLLSNESDASSLAGRAYRYLGVYHTENGDPASALHYLSLAHQHWSRSNEAPSYMARLAETTGMAYGMQGDLPSAIEQCTRALSLWSSLGSESGAASALNSIGMAHHRLAEYETALETFKEALVKSRSAGSIRVEAYALASLGDLYRDLGQFEQALDAYEQALERNQYMGEAYLNSCLIHARAEALYLAGQVERAQAEIELALSRKMLSKMHEAHHRVVLAATLLDQRKNNQAKKELESVLLEPSLQSEVAFRGHLQLAQAAMIENHPQESQKHLHTAIHLAQEAGLTQPLCVESLNHIQVLEFVTAQEGQSTELKEWISAAKQLEQTRKRLAKASEASSRRSYPVLQINALGTSRVLKDNQLVSWRTTQAKELFFYLLAHPDGQTKEQVGVTLWPVHSRSKLSSIFRSSLFRVRKALFSEVVLFEGETYRLNPSIDCRYDVEDFETAFTKGELADNPVQKAHFYRQALACYKGEFLSDLYAGWIQHFREALQARYLKGLAFLADFNLDNRNHPRAIEYARRILSVEELHEGAYHVLIRAYARSGQRPTAKRIYDEYIAMLSRFGLEPESDWNSLCH